MFFHVFSHRWSSTFDPPPFIGPDWSGTSSTSLIIQNRKKERSWKEKEEKWRILGVWLFSSISNVFSPMLRKREYSSLRQVEEGQQVRRRRPGVIYSTNQTFSYNFNILDAIIFPLHLGPKIQLSVIFWIFCAYHPWLSPPPSLKFLDLVKNLDVDRSDRLD